MPTVSATGPGLASDFDLTPTSGYSAIRRWTRRWRSLRDICFVVGLSLALIVSIPTLYFLSFSPGEYWSSLSLDPLLFLTEYGLLLLALVPSALIRLPSFVRAVGIGSSGLRVVRERGREQEIPWERLVRDGRLFEVQKGRRGTDPAPGGLVVRSLGLTVFLTPEAFVGMESEVLARGGGEPDVRRSIPRPLTSIDGLRADWRSFAGPEGYTAPTAHGRQETGPGTPAFSRFGVVTVLACVVIAGLLVQVGTHTALVPPFPPDFSRGDFYPGMGPAVETQWGTGTVEAAVTLNYSAERVWGQIFYFGSSFTGRVTASGTDALEVFDFSVSNPRMTFPWVLDRIAVSPDGRMEVVWPAYAPCIGIGGPCNPEYQIWIGIR